MKNRIFILISLLFSTLMAYSQPQQGKVHISGDFPKYRNSSVPFVFILSFDGKRVLEGKETNIKDGHFEISFEIDKPHYLVIQIDEQFLLINGSKAGIFVFPGDSLHLSVTDFGFDNITFTGKGAERLFLEKEYNIAIKENESSVLLRNANEKVKRANSWAEILQKLTKDFEKKIMTAEKNTVLLNNYVDIYKYSISSILKKGFYEEDVQFITDNIIENKQLKTLIALSNEERQIFGLNNSYHNLLKEYAYIKKSLINKRTYTPNKSIKDDYFTLNAIYKDLKIRNYVLANFIVRTSYRKSLDDGLDECFDHFFSNVASDDPLYASVETSFNKLNNNLTQGSMPPNFALTDSLGNSVRLHDFIGKVVVLDFWFNGCGGCAQITPSLEDVKETFDEKDDLIFVSISIDKKRENWLRGIGKFTPAEAIHLYTNGEGVNNSIIRYYNIYNFPTLMILDKQGQVFKARARLPYPNENDTKSQLIQEIKSALSN